MLMMKPKPGDRLVWEHVNTMISSKPLVTVHDLVFIEAIDLTHVSAIQQFGRWMILLKDRAGKIWPVGSKSCYTAEGYLNREDPGAASSG